MIQTIICYDLDGTLINSAPSIYNSIKWACFKESIKPPNFEKFKSHIGPPLNVYIKNLLELESSVEKKILNNFRSHHDNEGYLYYVLFDQVKDVLNFFKNRKVKQFIVTNKPSELAVKSLTYLGILDFFENIYSTRSMGEEIENKSFFLKKIKLDNQLYFVGDTEEDKIEADKSNSIFIFADYGYGKLKNSKLKISNPSQLMNLIKI